MEINWSITGPATATAAYFGLTLKRKFVTHLPVYIIELNGLTVSTRYYSVFVDRVRVLRGDERKAA